MLWSHKGNSRCIVKEKERKKRGRRALYTFRALKIVRAVTRCKMRRFVFRCLGSGQAGVVEQLQLQLNLTTPLQWRHSHKGTVKGLAEKVERRRPCLQTSEPSTDRRYPVLSVIIPYSQLSCLYKPLVQCEHSLY